MIFRMITYIWSLACLALFCRLTVAIPTNDSITMVLSLSETATFTLSNSVTNAQVVANLFWTYSGCGIEPVLSMADVVSSEILHAPYSLDLITDTMTGEHSSDLFSGVADFVSNRKTAISSTNVQTINTRAAMLCDVTARVVSICPLAHVSPSCRSAALTTLQTPNLIDSIDSAVQKLALSLSVPLQADLSAAVPMRNDSVAVMVSTTRSLFLNLDGPQQTFEVACNDRQYHAVRIDDGTENIVVEVRNLNCVGEPSTEVCQFGVVYLAYGACPGPKMFDYRQSFAKLSLISMSRTLDLNTGVYFIGVAADAFEGQFASRYTDNAMDLFPLQSMGCCRAPLRYSIRVYHSGATGDLRSTAFLIGFGFTLPLLLLLIGLQFHSSSRLRDAVVAQSNRIMVRIEGDVKHSVEMLDRARSSMVHGLTKTIQATVAVADALHLRVVEIGQKVDDDEHGLSVPINTPLTNAAEPSIATNIVEADTNNMDSSHPHIAEPSFVNPPVQSVPPAEAPIIHSDDSEDWNMDTDAGQRDLDEKSQLAVAEARIRRTRTYVLVLVFVAIFAAIPALEYEMRLRVDDERVLQRCHYNFRCKRDVSLFGWSSLASFNNLISNLFYIIGGLFLLAYTYILENSESRERIKRLNPALAEDEFLFYAIGIHFHLGIAMITEGIFSAIYHICPTAHTFQFDTMFMFFIAGLYFTALFQRRHVQAAVSAVTFFAFFSFVVLLNGIGVFLHGSNRDAQFWFFAAPMLFVTCVAFAIRIYHFKLNDREYAKMMLTTFVSITEITFTEPRSLWSLCIRPTRFNDARAITSTCIVEFGWMMYCAVNAVDSASFFLVGSVMLFMIYATYYMASKLYNGETVPRSAMLFLFLFLVSAGGGASYFIAGSSGKSLPLDQSREKNSNCVFLTFDNHDVWHMLSALALLFQFMVLYHVDDELTANTNGEISQF